VNNPTEGMSEEERSKVSDQEERYLNALHAMQSGVAMEMNFRVEPTDPKHMRVGINATMVETATLARLMWEKGMFTYLEYRTTLAEMMEQEKAIYEKRLSDLFGREVHLS